MNVLMISSGTNINFFRENSPEQQRMLRYGALVEELHIIVFSEQGYPGQKIGKNVWVYPTNSKSKWWYVPNAIRIGRRIRTVDLVTAQDPFEAGFVGWRISRRKRIPVQIQIHTDFLNSYFGAERFLNKIRTWMARFILRRASCVRVVSERIKNTIIEQYGVPATSVFVLPIYTDMKWIERQPIMFSLHEKYRQFDFIVLMMSRFEREKNIPLAIRAFSHVVHKYPRAGMIIAGSGNERKRLGELVTKLGLHKNIIFEGWVHDIPTYYKTADLFLVTSNYEGYGLTLVEAAVAGCPIVTTDVGLVGEVLTKDSALVCGVGDLECIRKSIILALENKKIRDRLAISAKDAVKKAETVHSKEEYLAEFGKGWESCRVS